MKVDKERLYSLIRSHPLPSFFLLLTLVLLLYPQSYASQFIFPRDPQQYLFQKFFVWNGDLYLGLSSLNNPSAIIFSFFEAEIYILFGSDAKKLSFVLLSILAGVSMYYLASLSSDRKVAKMASVVFYVFSLYNIASWETLEVARISIYATLPIVLALFIKGLEERSFKRIILLSVVLAISSGVGLNPSLLAVVFLLFATYTAVYILSENLWKDKNRLIDIAKYAVILISTAVLVNAYWFLPLVLGSQPITEFNPVQTFTFSAILLPLLAFVGVLIKWYDRYVVFASTVSVIGLALSASGLSYLWIGGISSSSFALLTILGYSILAGIATERMYNHVTARKGHKAALVFLLILLASYFTPSSTSPIESVPYNVFGVAEWMESREGMFRLALLPEEANESFPIYDKFLTLAGKPIVLKLCNTNCTPCEFVCKSGNSYGVLNVRYVAVEGSELTRLKREAEINGYSIYSIPNVSFLPRIYPASAVIPIDGNESRMFKFIASSRYYVSNVVFVLSNQTNSEKWRFIKDCAERQSIVVKVHNAEKAFNWKDLPAGSVEAVSYPDLGKTVIYIKTGPSPLRIAYISENNSAVTDITKTIWVTLTEGGPLEISRNYRAVIEIGHVINGSITLHLAQTTPSITFKRVNPTKYVVRVEDATQPFFLVFSESYHPQWKVYIKDEPVEPDRTIVDYSYINVKEAKHDWYKFTPEDVGFLLKKPLDERDHFVANGYANAWYIDPTDFDRNGDGEFAVILYFLPQSLFYLGLFISIASLFVCAGCLLYDWRRS